MTDNMLTPHDVAKKVGVSHHTIVAWCRDGKIPGATKVNGTRWRVTPDGLDEFLNPKPVRLAPRNARSEARIKRGAA